MMEFDIDQDDSFLKDKMLAGHPNSKTFSKWRSFQKFKGKWEHEMSVRMGENFMKDFERLEDFIFENKI